MFAPRRALLPLAILLTTLLVGPGHSQLKRPDKPKAFPPTDPLGGKLAAAQAAIAKENWPTALTALQEVLDAPRDKLLPLDDKPGAHRTSAQVEAARLLAALPPKGRTAYEAVSGPAAAALLKKANAAGSAEMLEQVVRRYLYTEAGVSALRALAGRKFAA